MKIVINTCHGGFGLSDAAVMRIAELKGIKIYMDNSAGYMTHFYTVPIEEFAAIRLSGNYSKSNDCYYSSRDIERTDPILIQVVEEMGAVVNGSCAKLAIIEIPDNVAYHIDEYDGLESIHEQHRSWG